MKQHHRPRLIMRAGGFQTESVKNHTDYRKVRKFEQKRASTFMYDAPIGVVTSSHLWLKINAYLITLVI